MIFGKGSKASFLNKYCGNNWIYMTCTLHYIKKNINGKSISVRLRKGIFKNNSETVTLDGNSDLWAENLKRILKQKRIFRDIQEDF